MKIKMKSVIGSLNKLIKVKRTIYHPSIHHIHKRYGISKRTLLYVKEYGKHSNVPRTIIMESIKVLLFASLLSSIGGLALENIKTIFISIMPLIILFPALNDMIGDYGTIISSRFSTLLYTNKIKDKWYKNIELKKLFLQILIISTFMAIMSAALSLLVSYFSNYSLNLEIAYKIFFISIIDVILLVVVLFLLAVLVGLYFYKRNEDPNNFLIPITTSIADFGNMFLIMFLVLLFF